MSGTNRTHNLGNTNLQEKRKSYQCSAEREQSERQGENERDLTEKSHESRVSRRLCFITMDAALGILGK
jgi:hypothetical protein